MQVYQSDSISEGQGPFHHHLLPLEDTHPRLGEEKQIAHSEVNFSVCKEIHRLPTVPDLPSKLPKAISFCGQGLLFHYWIWSGLGSSSPELTPSHFSQTISSFMDSPASTKRLLVIVCHPLREGNEPEQTVM